MTKPATTCTYCREPSAGPMHVDKYHRFAPLCGDCYYDPVAAKATASNPDDPTSWWNSAKAQAASA
jgi:hypothetical protein